MGYPFVSILNTTSYEVNGAVNYVPTLFCATDIYVILPGPGTSWTATSRGLCLITKVSATVQTPNGFIEATPYTSTGTSYSQFAIIQTGPTSFEVTRRVSGAEDLVPEDYVEPTSQQK